jgi:hypothetical protein
VVSTIHAPEEIPSMPLPSRPVPRLLLAVLLGASMLGATTVAVAAPQHRPHRLGDPGARPRGDVLRGQEQPQAPARHQEDPFLDPQPAYRRHGDDELSDSVRRVEQRTRGQVLSAERVPYDGRNLNRIKIVDERGRVRVYMDDPQRPEPPASSNASVPAAPAPTRDNDD